MINKTEKERLDHLFERFIDMGAKGRLDHGGYTIAETDYINQLITNKAYDMAYKLLEEWGVEIEQWKQY